jgi:hypothetical protein
MQNIFPIFVSVKLIKIVREEQILLMNRTKIKLKRRTNFINE